jgi:hypothetical protein
LTGLSCPTCFLTRATELALRGDLAGSVEQHAFGPLAAAALVGWSVLAIRRGRLLPGHLLGWPLAAGAAALVAYWLLRLAGGGFPSG